MTAGGSQMRLFVLAHLEITLRQFFDLLLFLFTEIGQAGIPLCGNRLGRLNTVGLQHRCRRQRRTDGRQWRQLLCKGERLFEAGDYARHRWRDS